MTTSCNFMYDPHFGLLFLFLAVCEHAYSLAQNLDPNSEGRGVLQFKTGLMSVIKVSLKNKNKLFPLFFQLVMHISLYALYEKLVFVYNKYISHCKFLTTPYFQYSFHLYFHFCDFYSCYAR